MSPSFPLVVVWSLIILPWLAAQSRSQNSVFSPVPSFQSDVERRQLSTSSRNGDVFVGAGGTLYRLSSELQQLQNVSVPGEVVALTTTADGDYLVACFKNRKCAAYNTTTLKNLDVALQLAIVPEGSSGSAEEMSPQNEHGFALTFENETLINTINFPNNIALFTAPTSGQLTLFIAFTERLTTQQNYYRDHFLRRRGASSNNHQRSREYFTHRHEIVGGFVYNTTAYFIGLALPPAFFEGAILFVYSWLPVRHGVSQIMIFACAGEPLRFDAMITSVSEVDGTVVVSVDGRVCSRNLASNEQVILINRGVTISLASSVERNLFLFVVRTEENTNRLNMEKHLFTAGSSGTTLLYSMPVSSPVTALSWSPAVDYVYATVGNKVVRFPLETCSSSANCSSCVTNGDPLCGWCSVEGKCSRRSQCQNNNETMRYLTQGDQSNCMNTVMFNPLQFVSEIESVPYQVNISFTPGNPPPTLPGETFLCVFSNEERIITFNTTLSHNMSCDLTSSLPMLTDTKLVTRFSLYSTLTKVFFFSVENGYTFYNCSRGFSCRGCVETDGNCGWCLYDFSCKIQFKDCFVPNSFITLNNSSQSYTDVCPVLSPPASSDSGGYVQPVNGESSLTVSGSNLPLLIGSVQYMCRFGSREATMGERLNSSAVKCNGKVSLSAGASGRENGTFELLLRNGNNVYTLDTSTGGSVFVVLYQCSDLAMGCSSCLAQRIRTDFQCGWRGNTCVDVSATFSTNLITESGKCPEPTITISPDSGPTEGRTTLTINGTDLGTSFGDIVKITVGSLTCTPIENSYLAGRSVTCDISSGSQTQLDSVDVTVVVRVSRMGGANQNATTQFRFGQPRVYSVSPLYGPAAGGTILRVRGEDLNIGNTERTTVSLVTTGSGRRRRRQYTNTTCAITSISANEIICRWSNVTATMSGVVLVTVNNAMVQNNSVTYQYLNNPVYTELTPQKTIRAGGIKLTFTGQYLNVSQQPRLHFNNHGENTSMCQQSSPGTTLVCIAPPLSVLNSYTVVMDAAPGPDNPLVDNPVAKQLRQDSRTLSLGVNDSTITIDGLRIDNVVKEEIKVMVGRDNCVVEATADTAITCFAPQRDKPVIENVTVSFGLNINNSVGQLEYTAGLDTAAIAGGVTGGVVLLIFTLLLIFSPILYCYLSSISKYKQELEIAQQSSIYTFIPSGDGVIEMKDNIVYLKSAANSGLPVAKDHTYEELPGDYARETSMDVLKNEQNLDDSSRSKGAEEQPTVDKSLKDEDDYYVNDDLFPEEYRMGNTSEKITVKKAREGVDDMLSDEANSTANTVITKNTS